MDIFQILRNWITENHPGSVITELSFDEENETYTLILDGETYHCPVGSDDEHFAFYNAAEVNSDHQEGILIPIEDLNLTFE